MFSMKKIAAAVVATSLCAGPVHAHAAASLSVAEVSRAGAPTGSQALSGEIADELELAVAILAAILAYIEIDDPDPESP
ncbi:MAG TPA: hypothetical protein VF582_05295 [Allosphingosinicella sp.]|jgi:hypothetical protein